VGGWGNGGRSSAATPELLHAVVDPPPPMRSPPVPTGPHLEVIAGLRLGVAAGRGRSAPAAGSHAGYGRPASAPST
jgi:hypothetical protein